MSSPLDQALIYGRVFAEVLTEKVEATVTDVLSDLGKLDAERNQWFREFSEEFQARTEKEMQNGGGVSSNSKQPITINIDDDEATPDLQQVIDDLRAEIAYLKAELREYRDRQSD